MLTFLPFSEYRFYQKCRKFAPIRSDTIIDSWNSLQIHDLNLHILNPLRCTEITTQQEAKTRIEFEPTAYFILLSEPINGKYSTVTFERNTWDFYIPGAIRHKTAINR